MPQEILKPETEKNKFDEEEKDDNELNKVIEEELKEQKGKKKEITIDERTGEMLTPAEIKERIEKGMER